METLMTNKLSYSDMVKLEPRLATLKEKCWVIWQAMHFSRTELQRNWYRSIKPQMCKLVGFGATVPELRSCEAYDYCYQYLFNILLTGREVN
jgi:hypothetical protein